MIFGAGRTWQNSLHPYRFFKGSSKVQLGRLISPCFSLEVVLWDLYLTSLRRNSVQETLHDDFQDFICDFFSA